MFLQSGCPYTNSGPQTSPSSEVSVTDPGNIENSQTNLNSIEDSRKTPTKTMVSFQFVGCWIGTKGGGLDIVINVN
jgi:hypothetical protein